MSPYNFMINLNEGATLVSQGGLLMAGIQNLVFSVYLVVAFRKNLDVFKVVMNSALVVYAVVFAVFFFPVGQHCWALGLSGNVFGHVFLISIDVLLLLRVLTLTPNTFVDKVVVGVLFANRLAATVTDLFLSTSRTAPPKTFDNCVFYANVFTGWWYLMSDVLCDIYASIRNYMIMNEAEKAVGGILFFGIYKNWNLSRSLLVLLINLTVGVITAFNRLDRSVYIMASAFQFIVLSYIMTYDMTLIKTVENAKARTASEKTLENEACEGSSEV